MPLILFVLPTSFFSPILHHRMPSWHRSLLSLIHTLHFHFLRFVFQTNLLTQIPNKPSIILYHKCLNCIWFSYELAHLPLLLNLKTLPTHTTEINHLAHVNIDQLPYARFKELHEELIILRGRACMLLLLLLLLWCLMVMLLVLMRMRLTAFCMFLLFNNIPNFP